MKLNSLFGISLAVIILFSSCARNIMIDYKSPEPHTGNVIIRPTVPIYANFTFNDSLFVKNKNVKTITIKNAPIGTNTFHFSGDSYNLKDVMDLKSNVEIVEGKTKTCLITTPPRSNGYWVFNSISTLAFLGFYIWLVDLP